MEDIRQKSRKYLDEMKVARKILQLISFNEPADIKFKRAYFW